MRYAVSDIHGCFSTFRYLIEEKIKLGKSDKLFLLGDYIDRGQDTRSLLDYLMKLQSDGYDLTLLRGNHEDIFLKVLEGIEDPVMWIYNGGGETLRSFGIRSNLSNIAEIKNHIPREYIDFIKKLLYYHLEKDYWLVHAGFNFSSNNPFSDYHAMLWSREFYINKELLGENKNYPGTYPFFH